MWARLKDTGSWRKNVSVVIRDVYSFVLNHFLIWHVWSHFISFYFEDLKDARSCAITKEPSNISTQSAWVQIRKEFERKVLINFLSISPNMCLGRSKEPSQWDGSFEYPQHMLWWRNKKNDLWLPPLTWGGLESACLYPKDWWLFMTGCCSA